MSPDPLRRRIAIAAVLAAAIPALVSPSIASAARTEILPRIDIGARHETNARLSRVVEDDATGIVVDGRLDISRQTATTRLFLNPRLRLSRYLETDDEDLEDNDLWITTGLNHRTARSLSELSVTFSSIGIRTSELDTASGSPGGSGNLAFIDDTQEAVSIDSSWTYQVTPRDVFSVTGGYSDISYDENKDRITGRFDYTYLSIDTSWQHSFTPRLALGVLLNASQFKSENPAVKNDPDNNRGRPTDNDSKTYGGSVFADFAFTETWSVSIYGGARTTEIELELVPLDFYFVPPIFLVPGETCDFISLTLDPPPCIEETEGDNFVGQVALVKSGQRTDFEASISRSIAPNSNGAETVRDEFRMNWRHDFSSRLNGRLGILYSEQEDAAVETSRDRNYLNADANLEWRLTRKWGFRAAYRYVWVEDKFSNAPNTDADNHYFFIGAFYRPSGWRWP